MSFTKPKPDKQEIKSKGGGLVEEAIEGMSGLRRKHESDYDIVFARANYDEKFHSRGLIFRIELGTCSTFHGVERDCGKLHLDGRISSSLVG